MLIVDFEYIEQFLPISRVATARFCFEYDLARIVPVRSFVCACTGMGYGGYGGVNENN